MEEHSKELHDFLRSAKDNGELCDLHTHLMGMGSAEFWLDEVIGKVESLVVTQFHIPVDP